MSWIATIKGKLENAIGSKTIKQDLLVLWVSRDLYDQINHETVRSHLTKSRVSIHLYSDQNLTAAMEAYHPGSKYDKVGIITKDPESLRGKKIKYIDARLLAVESIFPMEPSSIVDLRGPDPVEVTPQVTHVSLENLLRHQRELIRDHIQLLTSAKRYAEALDYIHSFGADTIGSVPHTKGDVIEVDLGYGFTFRFGFDEKYYEYLADLGVNNHLYPIGYLKSDPTYKMMRAYILHWRHRIVERDLTIEEVADLKNMRAFFITQDQDIEQGKFYNDEAINVRPISSAMIDRFFSFLLDEKNYMPKCVVEK